MTARGLVALLSLLAQLALLAGAAHAQPAVDDTPAGSVNRRPDERRTPQPFTVNLFDRPLALRLGYDLSIEQRGNFELNKARDRDRRARDQELKADARWRPTPQLTLLAEAVAISEVRRQKSTGTVTRNEGLQRGQLWLQLDGLAGTPLSLQAGRLPLVDRRTFWWDEDLDAVRLMARGPSGYAEIGFGRELARAASFDSGIALAHRGVRRWFGQAGWTWQPQHTLEAFVLRASDRSGTPAPGSLWHADDADAADARLAWLGLRASGNGRVGGDQRYVYWADLARVSGRETLTAFSAAGDLQRAGDSRQRRVRGHAVDLGAQWMAPWPLRPTFTLAWAQGSGAAPDAAVDRNFRQTGLQENKARLGGVKRLQRYGELLDPELSNLRVATAGIGLRLLDNTSVEAVWHQYRQAVASPVLAGSRLSQAPAGLDLRLGREIDLFLAWRESRHLEYTLLLARFVPGAAFAANRRDAAHSVELGIAFNH